MEEKKEKMEGNGKKVRESRSIPPARLERLQRPVQRPTPEGALPGIPLPRQMPKQRPVKRSKKVDRMIYRGPDRHPGKCLPSGLHSDPFQKCSA